MVTVIEFERIYVWYPPWIKGMNFTTIVTGNVIIKCEVVIYPA